MLATRFVVALRVVLCVDAAAVVPVSVVASGALSAAGVDWVLTAGAGSVVVGCAS